MRLTQATNNFPTVVEERCRPKNPQEWCNNAHLEDQSAVPLLSPDSRRTLSGNPLNILPAKRCRPDPVPKQPVWLAKNIQKIVDWIGPGPVSQLICRTVRTQGLRVKRHTRARFVRKD